ncbi:MAG: hypothetical protein ABEJ72_06110 [Candidatus Aenigmatarchaeota archaeon]
MTQSIWKVKGDVLAFGDFQNKEFVALDRIEGNTGQIENSRIDVSDRRVQLVQYVSGGSRDQAIHRAAREFKPIVLGINMAGEFAYVMVREPVEVQEEEADPEITISCPENEKETTRDILLTQREMRKPSSIPLFEEVEEWTQLYMEADERDKNRLENIVMGYRLFRFDLDSARS